MASLHLSLWPLHTPGCSPDHHKSIMEVINVQVERLNVALRTPVSTHIFCDWRLELGRSLIALSSAVLAVARLLERRNLPVETPHEGFARNPGRPKTWTVGASPPKDPKNFRM